MTDRKQEKVPSEVQQKVSPEVEVKSPAVEDGENPEDPISEAGEVPKTGDAPAD
ncbi:hypothetical protein H6G17_31185 [Chroococcidiopsis sp. FACHB-1243]|uniref:hypothetical protein n=1 Tax=Chroococcidiopsis sp. [FACHB-1243] TaxID=2692781 RepID=UPI00177B258D|nr:hypothetical protein [Chroococcidiopsis sp. [FACHB-1243]]MBD2309875.1 hypothetical protein [Chroococcidiopsis sp. [FACHB-1243]]